MLGLRDVDIKTVLEQVKGTKLHKQSTSVTSIVYNANFYQIFSMTDGWRIEMLNPDKTIGSSPILEILTGLWSQEDAANAFIAYLKKGEQ